MDLLLLTTSADWDAARFALSSICLVCACTDRFFTPHFFARAYLWVRFEVTSGRRSQRPQ